MSEPEEVPVHVAWSRVMRDVQAIKKGEKNSFQGFDFRGVDTVMSAVGPKLRDHGVMVVPIDVQSKNRDFQTDKGKLQHEAIVTVKYRITGPAGDSMEACSIGEASDTSDKATTQAMSVAYRILLLQALTVPTDAPEPDAQTVTRQAPTTPTDWDSVAEFAKLHTLHANVPTGDAFSTIQKWLNDNHITDRTLTKANARDYYDRITAAGVEPAKIETAKPASRGFSDAEADRTWKSLLAKQGNLEDKTATEVINQMKTEYGSFDSSTLTKAMSVRWNSLLEMALEEPF